MQNYFRLLVDAEVKEHARRRKKYFWKELLSVLLYSGALEFFATPDTRQHHFTIRKHKKMWLHAL